MAFPRKVAVTPEPPNVSKDTKELIRSEITNQIKERYETYHADLGEIRQKVDLMGKQTVDLTKRCIDLENHMDDDELEEDELDDDEDDEWLYDKDEDEDEEDMEPTNQKTGLMKKATRALSDEAGCAAWRVAALQFMKSAKAPVIGLLMRQMNKRGKKEKAYLQQLLETPIGESIFAVLLSLGLNTLPLGVGNNAGKRLAQELRILGMAQVGNMVADALMDPLRDTLKDALKGVNLPKQDE